MSSTSHAGDHETVGPKARKRLWIVFWILLGITLFEVGIALTPLNAVGNEGGRTFLRYLFISLTVVKAYYIIFFFMHLKYEQIGLKYALIGPFIMLIGYFVYMMMTEGNKINWIHMVFDKAV